MPASREAAHGGPLDGIHVLDLSSVVMGPLDEAGLTEEETARLAEAGVLSGDRAGSGRQAPAG